MTRLELLMGGTPDVAQDVARIKAAAPALTALPSGVVAVIWGLFSEEVFCAGAVDVCDGNLARFARFLEEEIA